jgi:hypothetical protein
MAEIMLRYESSNCVVEKTMRRDHEMIKEIFLKEHACSSEEHGGGWVGSSTKMRQDAPRWGN